MFPVRVILGESVYLWAVFAECFPPLDGDGKQKSKTIKDYGIDNHDRHNI